MATIPRSPLSTRIWQRDPTGVAIRAIAVGGTLLLTTLAGQDRVYAGPGQVPTYDWQNPTRLKPASLENRTFTTSSNLVSRYNNYSAGSSVTIRIWSKNPSAAIRAAMDVHSDLILNTLADQSANPQRNYDWPNPQRYKPLHQKHEWNGQSLYYDTPPYLNFDWPVPRGYAPLNRGWEVSYNNALNYTPPPPTALYDWPNPTLLRQAQQPKIYARGPVSAAPIPPFPTINYDWPNPQLGKPRPIDTRTWVWSSNLVQKYISFTVGGSTQFRTWNVDPKGRALRAQQEVQSAFLTNVYASPVGSQWLVNPVLLKDQTRQVHPQVWSLNLPLNVPPSKPFLQADWPVPKGYRYPTNLRTGINTLNLPIKYFAFTGGSGIVWRHPGERFPRQLRTWTVSFNENLLNPMPRISQHDWPNPVTKPRNTTFSIEGQKIYEPPVEPTVTFGGHFYPTKKEQAEANERGRLARERRDRERKEYQDDLNEQILDALHPERVIEREKARLAALEAETKQKKQAEIEALEESDVEMLLLNG